MKSYTVTITPDDGDGAKTIVKLDVDSQGARIRKLSLKAGTGAGLNAAQLPAINLAQLLASVMPATLSATSAPATPAVNRVAASGRAAAGVGDQTPTPAPAPRAETVAPKRRGPAKKAATTKAATTKTAGTLVPSPGKKTATKKALVANKTSTATGRMYRTMPDDFVTSHGKTTMVDLADVYQVPLHTVQGWVNTARKQGKIPPARSRTRT